MKKIRNQIPDKPVTESMLKDEMILVKNEFKLVRQEMREMIVEVIKGMQVMFDEQDRKNEEKFLMKDEFRAFKDQNLTMLDQIMVELKAMREEMTAFGYRQNEHTDQLDNHELRITGLEKHLKLAE